MSLVEVLIALVILSITVVVGMMQVEINSKELTTNNLAVTLQNLSTNLSSTILNDLAWTYTVTDSTNSSMSCLSGYVDCFGQTGTFQLRDSTGTVYFNSNDATAGFSISGQACTGFSATGSTLCPIGLKLKWTPICISGSCVNPMVQVSGTFTLNSTVKVNQVALARRNFNVLRQRVYGGIQTTPMTFGNFSGGVVVTSSSVASSSNLLVYPAGTGVTSSNLEPNQFLDVIYTYDLSYTNGAASTDAANQANFCFFAIGGNPNTAPCIYEWYQSKGNWVLRARGTIVYTASASDAMTAGNQFEFGWQNGQMTFYYQNHRRFVFSEIYSLPLSVAFHPGSVSYSPTGFANMVFNFL